MKSAALRDAVLLLARAGLGVIFVAHGWQKFHDFGLDGTAASFQQMGVPLPTASAWYAAIVELAGGVALILGVGLPVVGLLLVLDMLGALATVHISNGVFVTDNGFELVLGLACAAATLTLAGAGRFSLDRLLAPRLSRGLSQDPAPAPAGR